MNGKRTNIDFSKHVHTVEEYVCGENKIRVDHFKIPNTRMNYIQFVNTDEIMSVTGDFGNWIFCRPFVPSAKGYVSDSYWSEKLRILSEQRFDRLNFDAIEKEIQELIDTGLEDYGYEGEELEQAKEWFTELLSECDDKLNYLSKAYRDSDRPDFIDDEQIPYTIEVPNWLYVIFDAFDEICHRLKETEAENNK